MTWNRGTPLVPDIATLRTQTTIQDWANLETVGGLEVVDVLTAASDQLYEWVKKNHGDPTLLSNSVAYQPAVAQHAYAMFAKAGYLAAPEGEAVPLNPFDWSLPFAEHVGPEFSEGDTPPSIGGVIPRASNRSSSAYF